MKKIILHIGPGKCGSTTIQNFLSQYPRPCREEFDYEQIDPSLIQALNSDNPEQEALDNFIEKLRITAQTSDTFIISHESLFKATKSIHNICEAAACFYQQILIIGYSRRQSDFVKSAYSQWLFRSPQRIHEVTTAINSINLNSQLFTGLEKQMIAFVLDGPFSARQLSGQVIMNWWQGYREIEDITATRGTNVLCGSLAEANENNSLIEDFCAKSGLHPRPESLRACQQTANQKFHEGLIEAINNAHIMGQANIEPHDHNSLLETLSNQLPRQRTFDNKFTALLGDYIDSFFWQQNQLLCSKYNLDPEAFRPQRFIDKTAALQAINEESDRRANEATETIANYRSLAAELATLCIKLAEDMH